MNDQRKRRRVKLLQKYLLNPPVKLGVFLGLVPGHAILETTGRKSGKHRRTVVGVHPDGGALWIVAEQGRHAGYVRNLSAHPEVRVRLGGRWRSARGTVVESDDPQTRLESFGRPRHANIVRKVGTDLLSVRLDLD
ncbi:MAG: nitroreductase/quinone reductase family protein [Micromonosporaceae bacterium]